jgi:ribulose-phosphate 3-epimerase
MIEEPMKYAEQFFQAGADIVTVHIETLKDPEADLKKLKALGKIGLSLNPDRSFEDIKEYVHLADMVLVMSVFPGFGGQEFIEETLGTIQQLKRYFDEKGLDIDIQVDGGINKQTIQKVVEAGANILVAGSAVFSQPDPGQAFLELQNLARESAYVK